MEHGFWRALIQCGLTAVLIAVVRAWMSRAASKPHPSHENLLKHPPGVLAVFILGSIVFAVFFFLSLLAMPTPENSAMKIWACSIFGFFWFCSIYYIVYFARHWHRISNEGILSGQLIGGAKFLSWSDVVKATYKARGEYIQLTSCSGQTTNIASAKYLRGLPRFSEILLRKVSPDAISPELTAELSRMISKQPRAPR